MSSELAPSSAATIDRLLRTAGLAGIVGGIALAAAYVLHPPSAPPRTVASTL